MSGAPRNTRKEGVSTVTIPEKQWIDTPPLTSGQVNAKFRASLAGWRRHMISNARHYANVRQEAGLPGKPRYIVSDFGLVSYNGYDHRRFTWTYIPPQSASVNVWPQGKIRPWTYVFVHSFGGYFNQLRMWPRSQNCPKCSGNNNLLFLTNDKYGHLNKRWMGGLRPLTRSRGLDPNARRVSIHFCVSRRGDVVVSADLNDTAWHAGGGVLGFNSNNAVSIGFELEEDLIRAKRGGRTYVAPYTEPQLIALAIVMKKIETFRPIKHVYITKRAPGVDDDLGRATRLSQKYLSGYVQHSDVSLPSQRTDAAAQFNLLPGRGGEFGSSRWNGTGYREDNGIAWRDPRSGITYHKMKSGLDQLWGYMARVRKFDLATQVFAAEIPSLETALLGDLYVALQSSNKGQQALLRSHMKKVWALRRSINMEAKKRATLYGKAQDRGTKLYDILARMSANVSRIVSGFDASNLPSPQGPVQSFNEDTGTWYEDGQDTGSA